MAHIGEMIEVRVNNKRGKKGRRTLVAELLKVNCKTIKVRLPDGNIIDRRIGRDTDPLI